MTVLAHDFRSDNTSGVAPQILDALAGAAHGAAAPYGDDAWTARLTETLSGLFETEVAVFPVATGTAANTLALASLTPPFGAIYCHVESHVNTDECGAPEMATAGAKLIPIDGEHGRIQAAELDRVLTNAPRGVHWVKPSAVTLSQTTEAGTVYSPGEIADLTAIAHRHGLPVHLDGARFANALVKLGCTPAEATWKAGIDVMSFGATKNGALAAEAVVFFRPELAADTGFRRKRAGHLVSKMRFISAQYEAWLAGGLWLRLAGHANAMAARLAEGLLTIPGAALAHPADANEVFIRLPEASIKAAEDAGFAFYEWGGGVIRLVTSFDTPAAAVDRFIAVARPGAKG
jgi:threonine aldolase